MEGRGSLGVDRSLRVAAAGVAGHHPPPETDSTRIAQVLGDLPPAGEAVQDEIDSRPAHTQAPACAGNEKLRHAVLDDGRSARMRASGHHRKSDALRGFENDEGKRVAVTEPAGG